MKAIRNISVALVFNLCLSFGAYAAPPASLAHFGLDTMYNSYIMPDSSGNKIVGIAQGNPTLVQGEKNMALHFNGANQRIVVPKSKNLELHQGTITAWIKTPNAGSGYRGIFVKQAAFGLFMNENELGLYNWGGGNPATRWQGVGPNINLASNTWRHIALVFQFASHGGTKIYVDGQEVLTTRIDLERHDEDFMIGDGNANQFFTGDIDDVRIFSSKLTSNQIAEVINDSPRAVSPVPPGPNTWYAATNGSVQGTGNIDQPWDLKTALNSGNGKVQAGDTLLVKDGTYRGNFVSILRGTAEKPVIASSAPGARVHLIPSEGANHVFRSSRLGRYAQYRNFEISGAYGVGASGLQVDASDTKYINMVVHDNKNGVFSHLQATNSELYGLLVYNNGNSGYDHGIHILNNTGHKLIRDNLVSHNHGSGIAAYHRGGSIVKNMTFEGNILLMNQDGEVFGGLHELDPGQNEPPFEERSDNITVRSNFFYSNPKQPEKGGARLGSSHFGRSIVAENNYFMSGLTFLGWQNATIKNNKIWGVIKTNSGTQSVVIGCHNNAQSSLDGSKYTMSNNTYYKTDRFLSSQFALGRSDDNSCTPYSTRTFSQWQSLLNDSGSRYEEGALNTALNVHTPTGIETFVRPNIYDPNRAHVVVYNWDRKIDQPIRVDISSLGWGDGTYELRNGANYFGDTITGILDGSGFINLPMTGRKTLSPAKWGGTTFPEFGAFVLIKTSGTPPRIPLPPGRVQVQKN